MEGPDYLRFILAFAFVLTLMSVISYIVRRAGGGRFAIGKKADQRLSLIETRFIDGRHTLALVKCDNREYLLMLGPDHSRVIDADISKRDAA